MSHSTVATTELDVLNVHLPWCTTHTDPTLGGLILAGPGDGLCRQTVADAYGAIDLTHSADDGTTLSLDRIHTELTLDEAEALFRAGLALIATARRTGTA